MYDIHSHVLFDLDDGAKSVADSLALLRMAQDDGVRAIVATPHIRAPMWLNERPAIESRLEDVRHEAREAGLTIEVVLGSEIYFEAGIVEAVKSGAYPSYADGQKYVLFELPNYFLARQVQETVFEFRTAGVVPVLAHPERNAHLMNDLDSLRDLVRMGTLLQVTAMSITGKFGRKSKKAADQLLDENLVHVVASDAHSEVKRPALMGEAFRRIEKVYGAERASLLFVDNPKRVIDGAEVYPNRDVEPATGLKGLIKRWL